MDHSQDLIYLVLEWKWYVKFIFYPFFFQLSQPNNSSFYPDLGFFSAFSSKQFIFLPKSRFCSTFSMFFPNIFTSLLIFVFIFFFRWMKWVEDGSRPRFDLFGFRMKVVCEVHILSRFHFLQLSQPNISSFCPDLSFFQLSQANNSSSYYPFT